MASIAFKDALEGAKDVSVLLDTAKSYWNGSSLSASGSLTVALNAQNAENLFGQVKSTGTYDLNVLWKDDAGNTIRTESIASGVGAGTWTDLNQVLKSDYIVVEIVDTSASSQTVDGTIHLA